jgi:hypothetical protein
MFITLTITLEQIVGPEDDGMGYTHLHSAYDLRVLDFLSNNIITLKIIWGFVVLGQVSHFDRQPASICRFINPQINLNITHNP